jgi:hypothetical protein
MIKFGIEYKIVNEESAMMIEIVYVCTECVWLK